jgi:hypothetical protein
METADGAIQRRAFAKRRRGEPLSEQELQAYRTYFRAVRQLRAAFQWADAEEKKAMHERAQTEGAATFAGWLRSMVLRGMSQSSRPLEDWMRLESRLHQAEARLGDQMKIAHEMMDKASRYERARDDALDRLRDLEERLGHLRRAPGALA